MNNLQQTDDSILTPGVSVKLLFPHDIFAHTCPYHYNDKSQMSELISSFNGS